MARLNTAYELQTSSHRVLFIEKGSGVGERITSRRIGKTTIDRGAQFMTAKGIRFSSAVRCWLKMMWWKYGIQGSAEGHARWRSKPSMTAVAKILSLHVHLLLETRAVMLGNDPAGCIAAKEI